jgi:hypothetical protein
VEHAYSFTMEGRLLFHLTSNQPDHVLVDKSLEPHLAGAIFTHNHPGGHSLSENDLEFAMLIGLAEIRAVTRQARFVIRAPEGGWPYLTRLAVRAETARQRTLLIRELRRDIGLGRLSPARAELEFEHRLWSRVKESGLLEYVVEPWPGV